jgi:hypothetical protein
MKKRSLNFGFFVVIHSSVVVVSFSSFEWSFELERQQSKKTVSDDDSGSVVVES